MAFDKTLPIEGALAPTYNNIMRADKIALEAALNAYMYFATGGTQTGQPRQGQARPYFQDSAPATRLDGDHFDSTDLGTPWIDSNADPDNQFNILTAADGAGTNTWTPISTEIIAVLLAANRIFAGTLKSTGNFTVGANKVVVTAANGNTAIAGTLGVTGVTTVAKGSLLASSDAPTTDAMIPPKKFVDTKEDILVTQSTAGIFGSWTDKDSGGSNALAKDEVYKVGSDGFVTSIGSGWIQAYTDGSNPPTTLRFQDTDYGDSSKAGLILPVRKDDYWEINGTITAINWLPIGTGTCVKQ